MNVCVYKAQAIGYNFLLAKAAGLARVKQTIEQKETELRFVFEVNPPLLSPRRESVVPIGAPEVLMSDDAGRDMLLLNPAWQGEIFSAGLRYVSPQHDLTIDRYMEDGHMVEHVRYPERGIEMRRDKMPTDQIQGLFQEVLLRGLLTDAQARERLLERSFEFPEPDPTLGLEADIIGVQAESAIDGGERNPANLCPTAEEAEILAVHGMVLAENEADYLEIFESPDDLLVAVETLLDCPGRRKQRQFEFETMDTDYVPLALRPGGPRACEHLLGCVEAALCKDDEFRDFRQTWSEKEGYGILRVAGLPEVESEPMGSCGRRGGYKPASVRLLTLHCVLGAVVLHAWPHETPLLSFARLRFADSSPAGGCRSLGARRASALGMELFDSEAFESLFRKDNLKVSRGRIPQPRQRPWKAATRGGTRRCKKPVAKSSKTKNKVKRGKVQPRKRQDKQQRAMMKLQAAREKILAKPQPKLLTQAAYHLPGLIPLYGVGSKTPKAKRAAAREMISLLRRNLTMEEEFQSKRTLENMLSYKIDKARKLYNWTGKDFHNRSLPPDLKAAFSEKGLQNAFFLVWLNLKDKPVELQDETWLERWNMPRLCKMLEARHYKRAALKDISTMTTSMAV
ncbi:unnamed protein product [Symbiodinium microadriaticum]|nr:unnamed protein product [Symbiodinium microadriaticum]